VVEHLLCKQGAVGSIPTVSILCERWSKVCLVGGVRSGASLAVIPWEGAHVPLHDRFRCPATIPRRGWSGAAVLFDR
jgi:hypothetical protein